MQAARGMLRELVRSWVHGDTADGGEEAALRCASGLARWVGFAGEGGGSRGTVMAGLLCAFCLYCAAWLSLASLQALPPPLVPLCRVYEAVAGLDKRRASKYCLAMLADYLTTAAVATAAAEPTGRHSTTTTHGDSSSSSSSSGAGDDGTVPARLRSGGTAAAAATLRRGAFCLLSCLGPAELQHLHTVLGPGLGEARRAALAALRVDYDKAFKFEGKV